MESRVLNTLPGPRLAVSVAATALLHTASPFQNLPCSFRTGLLLWSLRSQRHHGNNLKHRSPGLSAINNPDRFNKYRCTTAICGEFMRN